MSYIIKQLNCNYIVIHLWWLLLKGMSLWLGSSWLCSFATPPVPVRPTAPVVMRLLLIYNSEAIARLLSSWRQSFKSFLLTLRKAYLKFLPALCQSCIYQESFITAEASEVSDNLCGRLLSCMWVHRLWGKFRLVWTKYKVLLTALSSWWEGVSLLPEISVWTPALHWISVGAGANHQDTQPHSSFKCRITIPNYWAGRVQRGLKQFDGKKCCSHGASKVQQLPWHADKLWWRDLCAYTCLCCPLLKDKSIQI